MLDQVQQDLLAVLSARLFSNTDTMQPDYTVCSESKKQGVFPLVAPYIGRLHVAANLNVLQAHCELYDLLAQQKIPCVMIKGWASSVYYPDPILRQLGDVDFMVSFAFRDQAGEIMLKNGYSLTETDDPHHWGYKKDGIDHELHWRLNGAPEGAVGERVESYLLDFFENARMVDTPAGAFKIPSDFHNGLIQLLHMAKHMTSSGMGLRHLCDWAVYVNTIEGLEALLKPCCIDLGIWRFACLMTSVCTRYLGLAKQPWAAEYDFADELLEEVLLDILGAGDFGVKKKANYAGMLLGDLNKDASTNKYNRFQNMLRSLNSMSRNYLPVTKICPILLPVGWVYVTLQYLVRVIRGDRKLLNPIKLVSEAKGRERLYASFQLFEQVES